MITSILIGLLGLGFVVTIHEYGHLLAAKIVGVGVKVFSIGWGKKLYSLMIRNTEYRISMLPIGGYVKLTGDEAIADAHARNEHTVAHVPNGFFSVAPWRRIVIASGGPIFNIIAAAIIFIVIFSIGYNVSTHENRIVLVSDFEQAQYPADEAGLMSGDRIVSVNGVDTDYFFQIRNLIVGVGDKPIEITAERNGMRLALKTQGQIDTRSGATVLGVYPWIAPVIDSVAAGEAADIVGLMAGDEVIAVNGQPVEHAFQVSQFIRDASTATVTVMRNQTEKEFRIPVGENEDGSPGIGIRFTGVIARVPALSIGHAATQATQEIGRVFRLTTRGIISMFSGTQLNNIIAGPIQLTSIIGDVAKSGGEQGVWAAMRLLFNFLAIINVALCFMNILPIPILDGGQMLLYAVETIRRKALRPRTIIRYQQIGGICVLLLLVLALTSDFFFLVN